MALWWNNAEVWKTLSDRYFHYLPRQLRRYANLNGELVASTTSPLRLVAGHREQFAIPSNMALAQRYRHFVEIQRGLLGIKRKTEDGADIAKPSTLTCSSGAFVSSDYRFWLRRSESRCVVPASTACFECFAELRSRISHRAEGTQGEAWPAARNGSTG